MDLSKAFDLVNHDVLRSKLAKYHVSPEALEWFTSYLSNRSQQCYMSGSLSSPLELKVGVPQGSIGVKIDKHLRCFDTVFFGPYLTFKIGS